MWERCYSGCSGSTAYGIVNMSCNLSVEYWGLEPLSELIPSFHAYVISVYRYNICEFDMFTVVNFFNVLLL